jgi:hypothetical protein
MKWWLLTTLLAGLVCSLPGAVGGVTLARWQDERPLADATVRAGTMNTPVLACETTGGVVGVALTEARLSWSVPPGGVPAVSFVIFKDSGAVARVPSSTMSWTVPDGEAGSYTVMSSLAADTTAPGTTTFWSSPRSAPVVVMESLLGLGEYCEEDS